MIPFTCPCCEVPSPPHTDGCTFHDDCPADAETFDEVSALRSEIARLREERRWVESRVVISRETFDKVVEALGRHTTGDDGEDEYSNDDVIEALESIRRDERKPLPPEQETKEDGNG